METLKFIALDAAGNLHKWIPPHSTTHLESAYHSLPLSVYSVIRTFEHNQFLHLDDHIARMQKSIQVLTWNFTINWSRLCQTLHIICTQSEWPEARVRIDVFNSPFPVNDAETRILIGLSQLKSIPQEIYNKGVSVGLAQDLLRKQPLVKTADFIERRQTYYQEKRGDHYEYLIVDKQSRILEGASSNFYTVLDGIVYTAKKGILEGITRKIVLELLVGLKIPVVFEPVNAKSISTLDEAFISSSTRGVVPVVRIDHETVGAGRPAQVFHRLYQAYQEYIASHLHTAEETCHLYS